MSIRILFTTAALLISSVAVAAPKEALQYTPGTCIRAGELPLLQVAVEGKGELRSYFRRTNSTDWCSVEGTNDGPLSRVVLPKFEAGEEIEYFFVLLDGRRVVARSPRIYRARVNAECESPWARHIVQLSLNCGNDAQGIPTSLGAGYAVTDNYVAGSLPNPSPDSPNQ